MRLLLTSSGITTSALADELVGLLGFDPRTARLAFVPTAANVEDGDKGWLVDDLVRLRDVGFAQVDLVDVSALPRQIWEPRLRSADVIAVGGGNTPHLLDELRRTGAGEVISTLLAERVYVGIGAGSIVAGREAIRALSSDLYGEDTGDCLALVDLVILPHLNSPEFPNAREDRIRAHADEYVNVYALDDRSAVRVVDGVEAVVGGGHVVHLNPIPGGSAPLSS